jgi:hypothetical protein
MTRLLLLCLTLFASAGANARPVDVTNRWRVTISFGGETITGVSLLQHRGDNVTGSIGPMDATVSTRWSAGLT